MTAVLQSGNIWQQAATNLNQCSSAEILQLLEKYQMLPQLIKEVVLDQAIAPISCTAEEEKIASEKLAQHYQITSDDAGERWLEQNHLSREQFRAIAIRQFKIEKFKHLTWGSDLESYFSQRKPQLNRVVYSLIRTNDIGIAQEIYFRLQAGEQTFAELAREYSQGTEAQTNGLIGPVELQTIHPALAKILATSQPKQLLPPTQLENWIVIVRLEKLLLTQLDNSLRQRLLNERFHTWLQAQMTAQP
ncbi:peptidylprolyl isomerase [Nodularia sphaerocarpa]|uniref:peptidylprolyl isomerase n=1 Tax=Nodularia sphaerocarpa TaxID=137816 RepID=UPI001EFAAF95|nr:peptidylprolyl isomerase [Nodularia sphaerocarpa]MDB9373037.1 peptidylprolyl isomerase [Nodularia sphaerocarpa CS-585]MDB9379421.1 peptidylprolyl isomerase [Nodularia sphaerocarpa CS-585A2]ULP74499.1 Foldase protein PrsA [Nodularia sphaerocarpa UHCC 0038]